MEQVILVDEHDREVGTANKLDAHRGEGRLHRAFSVFLFDPEGRMLVQRRAAGKYHFPSLRSNACCSHPRPGEDVSAAARRRVREELGVDVALRAVFAFVYTARDTRSGLAEREYDHVFVGTLQSEPVPDPQEVDSVAWVEPGDLLHDVARHPERYTPWFREALPGLVQRGLLRG